MGTRLNLVATLVLHCAVAPTAKAAEVPPSFAITDISYQGSGCPSGSVAYNISPDRKAFTVLFDQYTNDTTLPTRGASVGCSLVLNTSYPAGWSFSLPSIVYRGYAALEGARVGRFCHLVRIEGAATGGRVLQPVCTQLSGPHDGDFQVVGTPLAWWSPCWPVASFAPSRVTLNTLIDFQARRPQNGVSGRGYIGVDSIEGDLLQTYRVVWKRCT